MTHWKLLNKTLKECLYCCKVTNVPNYNRHLSNCYLNPKNIRLCEICNNPIKKYKINTTCSYSCSNKKFRHSNEGGTQYKSDDQLLENNRYRDICFRYHDRKCIICEEDKIVEVHHLDENKENNSPENLIPICPTHHQYWHSRYKYLIDKQVEEYIIAWKFNNSV